MARLVTSGLISFCEDKIFKQLEKERKTRKKVVLMIN